MDVGLPGSKAGEEKERGLHGAHKVGARAKARYLQRNGDGIV